MSELKYINFSTKEHFTTITITVNTEDDLIDLITTSDYKNGEWYQRGTSTIKKVSFDNYITSLQDLELSFHNIGDDGAKALAGALQNNTSLFRLNLTNNKNLFLK